MFVLLHFALLSADGWGWLILSGGGLVLFI
jgi:hypothetical protein